MIPSTVTVVTNFFFFGFWNFFYYDFFVVQLLSRSVVSDFVTPWTAARQGSLSFTISWILLIIIITNT